MRTVLHSDGSEKRTGSVPTTDFFRSFNSEDVQEMLICKVASLSLLAGAVILLAACATTVSSQIAPVPAIQSMDDANHAAPFLPPSGTVYVANTGGGGILLFNNNVKHPRQIGKIVDTGGIPYADVIDDLGMLYILDDANDVIYEYPRGAIHPSLILKKGLESGAAFTLAVGRDQTLYVGFLTGQVVEYDLGATSPSRTILLSAVGGMDLDSHDNLYVATTEDSPSPESYGVFEFAHRALTGRALGMHVGIAGGLQIDKMGSVVLGDQTAGTISIFPPGHSVPSKIIPALDPYNFALDKNNAFLYVAGTPTLTIYNYPGGSVAGYIGGNAKYAAGVAISQL